MTGYRTVARACRPTPATLPRLDFAGSVPASLVFHMSSQQFQPELAGLVERADIMSKQA